MATIRKPKPVKKKPAVKKETKDKKEKELRVPPGYRMPERIYAQASPRSAGGVSLFEGQQQIEADTVPNFASDQEAIEAAASRLAEAGFEVLQASSITINISGSRETYEKAFKTRIVPEERAVIKPVEGETSATFLDSPDTELPGLIETRGTPFEDVLEGVALEEPRYYMAASQFAPLKAYWHLRVPGDVSLGTNADRAHRAGYTGTGIRVAMCDSGWFKHPYFVNRGYRVAPVTLGPGAANPLADESGHGTGESANIFAVAPDVQLFPVKMSFVNAVGGFNAAVGLNPHIITCSWGSNKPSGPLSAADQALAAAIAAAVASGIVVIFSAGNGQWGFPGQHPDVISAGGVFMNPDGTMKASNYASGFQSNIYAGRRSPDLCGLVGLLPSAAYIMLPVEPGDQIDVQLAGGAHPAKDETSNNDGWAAFSGTSAAAPQLAGAAALVKQACSKLTPAEVKDVLIKSARDVTTGTSHSNTGGHAATVGPDLATGTGLVDAQKAALVARLRCLTPIGPIGPPISPPIGPISPLSQDPLGFEEMGPTPVRPPIRPVRPPIRPIRPVRPVRPPIRPIRPIEPIVPIVPIRPIIPIEPIRPIEPVRPVRPPIRPIEPPIAAPGGPEGITELDSSAEGSEGVRPQSLSSEEVQALEDMILGSDIGLGDEQP